MHLFERIHFFLQRLNSYTRISLTREFTELLGKIMAQILSILALSTRVVTERRMSELVHDLCPSLADYGTEKLLKRLMGRTEVEDALLRLDSLTKEESLMAVAKNLDVTHHIDDNVKDIKVLAGDIDEKVHWVDQNMKAAKERTQPFLFPFTTYQPYFLSCLKTGTEEQNRMSLEGIISECPC